MSYRGAVLAGLGEANAPEVRTFEVGPGWLKPWLDAALAVQGIPSAQASRVPDAVRRTLQESGAEVERVEWGGGSGLEDIRGRVYVRWKPGRPENAVTYADIARHIFAAAAEGFPAGAQILMSRYRIDRTWPLSDLYVYPEGGPLPASAPEVARRSSVADISTDPQVPSHAESRIASEVLPIVGVVGGVAVLAIGGTIAYFALRRRRVARNRRSRRRRPVSNRRRPDKLWLFNWIGGGYNTVVAPDRKTALAKARRKWAAGPGVDVKTLRQATWDDVDREESRYGGIHS